MNTMRRLASAGGFGIAAVLAVAMACAAAAAQASHQPNTDEGAQGNGANQPAKPPMAIESEMFTYSAMDAESAALACNVAQNLGAADSKCASKGPMSNAPGVVMVGEDSTALAEFQLWRADISTMDILTRRADRYCPQQSQRGVISSLEKLLGGSPEGQILSLAKALLTTKSVKTQVEGNILDQTLMNDIAGHLRALGVSVVIPDTYMPHSLVTIDEARSPYLSKFLALMAARGCVEQKAGGTGEEAKPAAPPAGADQAADREKQAIAQAIDSFLESLTRPEVTPPPGRPSGAPAAASEPQVPSISHLDAVMRADGLAQEMGFDVSRASAGDNAPWDVLWLKALESGGDVVASDNLIKGSKVTYTGGAVGTYALFHLNGELECSGVFFNLAPAMAYGDIPKLLDGSATVPPGRLVGGCNTK
jgi:hypothetical protein